MNRTFPTLPKRKILEILKSRELENVPLLTTLNSYLVKQRGYIVKLPRPGTPVISLMSGGLDTTVVTEYLLRVLKLQVYPVYMNRYKPNSKKAAQTVSYFSKRFTKLFPDLYHPPITFDIHIPPKPLEKTIFKSQNDVVPHFAHKHKGIPFQPNVYAYWCAYYARSLYEQHHINIHTVIGAWIPSNSDWYSYETVTAFRLIMLNLVIMIGDNSFQFFSLPMEPELGYFFDKETLIQWGQLVGVPLEKTWTCRGGGIFQCGHCTQCSVRREKFRLSGIRDRTVYQNELAVKFRKKLKSYIRA